MKALTARGWWCKEFPELASASCDRRINQSPQPFLAPLGDVGGATPANSWFYPNYFTTCMRHRHTDAFTLYTHINAYSSPLNNNTSSLLMEPLFRLKKPLICWLINCANPGRVLKGACRKKTRLRNTISSWISTRENNLSHKKISRSRYKVHRSRRQ